MWHHSLSALEKIWAPIYEQKIRTRIILKNISDIGQSIVVIRSTGWVGKR